MTFPYTGRREDPRLLTGTGRYTADWTLPGQLHAVFVRADRAHADIVAVATAAARAAPGVLAVLTGEDAVEAGLDRPNASLPFTGRGGRSLAAPARPVLAARRVRYVGEPVALVAAETLVQAQDAAELIAIEYADRPVAASLDAALAPGAPVLHAEAPGNICFEFEYGDKAATDAAFAGAAHVTRLELISTRLVGAPMEPKAALVAWDGARADIWTGNQGTRAFATSFAALTGLARDAIRVHARDVGGAFGIRSNAYPEHAALLLAAQRTGRPVRWVASRAETFLSDYHGRAIKMRGELALDADGRFLAIRHDWLCDLGAYPAAVGPGISTLNPSVMAGGCYRIAAIHGLHRLVLTNTVPITAYRGAGRPDMAYIVERMVDQAARETGRDRLALRKLNAIPADAFPYRPPVTGPAAAAYDSGDYASLLDTAAREADWAGFEARRSEAGVRGKLRGIGCALFVEPAGGVAPKDEAAIIFGEDGTIVLHNPAQSSGQGHETVFPQIVAAVFGIAPETIVLRQGDPNSPALAGGGSFASRSMITHGAVAHVAARQVVEKAKVLAAAALEVAEPDLEYVRGAYRVAGTDRAVTLLELAARNPGALDTKSELPAARAFPAGAHVAEVEADPETGGVALIRYTAVDDSGVVLNSTLLRAQIVGGMLQGLGQVMAEACAYDADGQLLTGSFMDYAMPHADMLTEIAVHEHPVPSPTNPLGVKGGGESGTIGALPATMNAILDALAAVGVRDLDMPASAERVWRALHPR